MKYILIFSVGAAGYTGLEVLWRGYTHWTMAVTGGVCFLIIFLLNGVFSYESVLFRSLVGASVITAAELIVGVVVNIILRWNIWDYSRIPFNFIGQICLIYSLLWFLLCIPLIYVCNSIARLI